MNNKTYLHRIKLREALRKTFFKLLYSKQDALPCFKRPEIRRNRYSQFAECRYQRQLNRNLTIEIVCLPSTLAQKYKKRYMYSMNSSTAVLYTFFSFLYYLTYLRTTCISPFSPGMGRHGLGRDSFSLEPREQWSNVSTI